jgi:hypothetical protein
MSCRPPVILIGLLAVAAAQWDAAAQSTPSSTASSPAAGAAIPEVTIQARRAELEAKVAKFVDQITVVENGGEGGLALWDTPPVCPLVSGLPGPEGEFILERFTEIGRKAGAPLAGERCMPNLYILVTIQPEELLHAMEKRNRAFTFGHQNAGGALTPASIVDEFIATPRAVRVWYNQKTQTPEGLPPANCGGPGSFVPCNLHAPPSLLRLDLVRTFSTVFVVVDQRRLQGISRGQLADYVAMVGLAKLKPEAHLGDTQTILRLFDGAPAAAAAGLTGWDQAFLASLYKTDHDSRLQRSQISHSMVPTIAP